MVSARADVVARDREPAIDIDRQAHARSREQYAQRHRGAIHVFVHRVHVARRLEIVPAGIEADALADQRDAFPRARMRIFQMHDRGVARVAALRHRAKCAGAHFPELPVIVFLAPPAVLSRKPFDALAIRRGREFVRRQLRQFAAQQVAFRPRAQRGELFLVTITVQMYRLERFACDFLLALGQRRTIYPSAIHRQLRRPPALRAVSAHDNGDLGRVLGEQRLQCAAHRRLRFESGFCCVEHHPTGERAVLEIAGNGGFREFARLHAATRDE